MKAKSIIVMFIAMFISLVTFAQQPALKFPPLEFKNTTIPHFIPLIPGNIMSKNSIMDWSTICIKPHPSMETLPASVKYPAAFCKMELALREHLNIWVKVHAGDYDTYNKPANPQ